MTNRIESGENNSNYNYTVLDVFRIKKSNLVWHIIDILSCKFKKIATKYQKTVMTQYKRESELFNLEKSKNILHIGCGAFPISTMVLHEVNGGKIVGIDSNSKLVNLAKNVIKNKNLSDRIEIKHGNGTNFPIDDYDTIIISGCSIPRIKVLDHVIRAAKPNTKIIVREIYCQNKPIEKLINSSKNIKVIKKIDNRPVPTAGWESFYLIKKE